MPATAMPTQPHANKILPACSSSIPNAVLPFPFYPHNTFLYPCFILILLIPMSFCHHIITFDVLTFIVFVHPNVVILLSSYLNMFVFFVIPLYQSLYIYIYIYIYIYLNILTSLSYILYRYIIIPLNHFVLYHIHIS